MMMIDITLELVFFRSILCRTIIYQQTENISGNETQEIFIFFEKLFENRTEDY
jgi:hypothetical protein